MVKRLYVVLLFIVLAACGEAVGVPDATPVELPDAAPTSDAAATTAELTVVVAGPGAGAVTSAPAGITCGAVCSADFAVGATVTLTATAEPGSVFAGWSGAGCSGTGPCAVTVSAAASVTATFEIATRTVTVSLMGTGVGSVTSTPAGLTCPGGCTLTVPDGTAIVLTATAASGSTFAGWSGPCSGTGTCAITATSDVTVSAAFVANHELLVVPSGTGAGTVTSSPAGINCGPDCSELYPPGTMVTLTAAAAASSTFTGWSGAGCAGTGTCSVTMSSAAMVTANFTLRQHLLTVTRVGAGTVTSVPAGISCGVDCSELYDHGTAVTLTAAADASTTFAGWSGGGCTGTGPCVTTITAATTVTATFALRQYNLMVTRAGNGTGTVTSSPAGINCGVDCAETLNHGTMVTLTATASPGSTFAGWSGACTGTGACVVSMTADRSVTANFDLLSVQISAGWACTFGASCTDFYDFTFSADTNVTVAVTSVTGASVVRLSAFVGASIAGTNLLTGQAIDRECVGQNASDTVTFKAVGAGAYRLGVGRDWGSSAGTSGTYVVTVTANRPMGYVGTNNNDITPSATTSQCGYTFTAASAWTCAAGVSCQDVFDFGTLAATPMSVAISSVTGASVPRLAVFDGTALTTTNRLNGLTSDRMCVGQNANDSATSATLPLGNHRVAVGRDWGSSAGASGTYTVTITTPNAPLTPVGQTGDNVATGLPATSCP